MAKDPETNIDYEGKINMLTHLYSNLLVNCGARVFYGDPYFDFYFLLS